MSYLSQERSYTLLLADELQNFLNDIVTDSPHLGRAKSRDGLSTTLGARQLTKKRPNDPLVDASKIWKRGEGAGLEEVVVAEVNVEAVAELFQTLAELIMAPSMEY
jgi:hypothetical protein